MLLLATFYTSYFRLYFRLCICLNKLYNLYIDLYQSIYKLNSMKNKLFYKYNQYVYKIKGYYQI